MITPPSENPTKLTLLIKGLVFKNYLISSDATLPISSIFYNIFYDIFLSTRKCGVQKYEIKDLALLISC